MRCVRDVARTQCLAYPINERCATCRISKLRWRHGRGAQSRIRKARGRSLLTVTGLCLSDTVFSGYRSTPCDVVESALPQAERVGEAAAVTDAAIAVAIAITVTVLAIAVLVVLVILAVAVGIGAGRTGSPTTPPDRASRPHSWSCRRARWSASPCLPKPRHERNQAASSCCSRRCR